MLNAIGPHYSFNNCMSKRRRTND